METRKINHPNALEQVLRLTNRAILTLDVYREILGELDAYQRFFDLSSRYKVNLRGPFIVIEGGLSGKQSRPACRTHQAGSGKVIRLVEKSLKRVHSIDPQAG